MRCDERWVQQMLSDQLPSVEALANRFNEFLGSLTAEFTSLPSQPSGQFFSVPDYLIYTSPRLVRSVQLVRVVKQWFTKHLPCFAL